MFFRKQRLVQCPELAHLCRTTDKDVTLDIRWTVLCDLFLILIADSVYDARSRVLLETIALKLGLGWMDVVKFEQRVTEALRNTGGGRENGTEGYHRGQDEGFEEEADRYARPCYAGYE